RKGFLLSSSLRLCDFAWDSILSRAAGRPGRRRRGQRRIDPTSQSQGPCWSAPAAGQPLEHRPAGRIRRQVAQQGLHLLGPHAPGRRPESLVESPTLGGELNPRDGLFVRRRPLFGALAGRAVAVQPQSARALKRDHDQVAVAFPAQAQEAEESHVCLRWSRQRFESTGDAGNIAPPGSDSMTVGPSQIKRMALSVLQPRRGDRPQPRGGGSATPGTRRPHLPPTPGGGPKHSPPPGPPPFCPPAPPAVRLPPPPPPLL